MSRLYLRGLRAPTTPNYRARCPRRSPHLVQRRGAGRSGGRHLLHDGDVVQVYSPYSAAAAGTTTAAGKPVLHFAPYGLRVLHSLSESFLRFVVRNRKVKVRHILFSAAIALGCATHAMGGVPNAEEVTPGPEYEMYSTDNTAPWGCIHEADTKRLMKLPTKQRVDAMLLLMHDTKCRVWSDGDVVELESGATKPGKVTTEIVDPSNYKLPFWVVPSNQLKKR